MLITLERTNRIDVIQPKAMSAPATLHTVRCPTTDSRIIPPRIVGMP
ncbi:Uncharacterised protein [Mycobacteroides abscessus subsp. abscessus]|nr:Uncharacterised protein [Mycobacteroides abscessus subsp. abscessus]